MHYLTTLPSLTLSEYNVQVSLYVALSQNGIHKRKN